MRNAWLTTAAALLCVVAFAAENAYADPAAMAMQVKKSGQRESTKSFWPLSKKTTPAPAPLPTATAVDRPTAHISPSEHPIKYFKAAVSEMPIGKNGGKMASAPRQSMPPAQQRVDSISLSVPTGPPSPEFFIYAAQACERQNDIPQARANFERALSIWPGQLDVLRAAAQMEDRQGNLPLAENLYQRAVAANPQHAGALNDLGICLARQGKLDVSVPVLERAVILQPKKALYRNNAATVLVELRQDQRALGHLAAVHGPAEANFNLGQLLVDRNRGLEAAPYFQAALQHNPAMQPAQEALAKLQPPLAAPATQVAVTQPAATSQETQAAPGAPVTSQAVTPVGPPATTQPTSPTPQYGYPATAQAPPTSAQGATPPRYLPPVASRPGEMRR